MPQQRMAVFRPLRGPPEAKRRLLLLVGPTLWLVALVVLALVVHRTDAVEVALLVVAASFAAGLAASTWMRRGRLREERRV